MIDIPDIPITDSSRVEIRVNGPGSLSVVGVHIELHWWYTWHYIPKSIII